MSRTVILVDLAAQYVLLHQNLDGIFVLTWGLLKVYAYDHKNQRRTIEFIAPKTLNLYYLRE